jgi:alpha-L-fucosidase 2
MDRACYVAWLHVAGGASIIRRASFAPPLKEPVMSPWPRRICRLVLVVAFGFVLDAASAQDVVTRKDVVYGTVKGAGLVADIAHPPGAGPFPAILSVHGGRWYAGHRADKSSIVPAQWAGFGFFAMTIDYRLRDCTPAPACYQDLQCAIRWLHAHAAEFNVDVNRIFLIGQSAGGHLVSLAGTLGEGPYAKTGGWEDQRSDFRAVISVAAPYELPTLDWGNVWTPPGEDVDAARKLASPLYHVTAKTKPILVIHSDDDKSVPIQQAVDMAAALEKAGMPHRFVHYTDKGHMGITPDVIEASLKFIEEQSK